MPRPHACSRRALQAASFPQGPVTLLVPWPPVGPALKNAPDDGYLIAQLPITLYRAPLQRKVAWGPLRDIAPVIQVSGVTFGIVVPADSAFRTLAELVAWGRAHPGRLTVGSTGIGSTAHLAMEDVLSRRRCCTRARCASTARRQPCARRRGRPACRPPSCN